jgi:hypothetical protein
MRNLVFFVNDASWLEHNRVMQERDRKRASASTISENR